MPSTAPPTPPQGCLPPTPFQDGEVAGESEMHELQGKWRLRRGLQISAPAPSPPNPLPNTRLLLFLFPPGVLGGCCGLSTVPNPEPELRNSTRCDPMVTTSRGAGLQCTSVWCLLGASHFYIPHLDINSAQEPPPPGSPPPF